MNRIHRVSGLAAVLLLTALSACGGGGGADTASPPPTNGGQAWPPVGVFDVNYGQFRGTYAFLDDGSFYGVHFVSGTELAGHPHGPLSANNSTTSMEPIGWANFIDDDAMVGAQEPSGRFGRSFGTDSLSVKISGSMGTFTSIVRAQKVFSSTDSRTIYDHPLPMSTVAGSYNGTLRTVGPHRPQASIAGLTIAADGSFSVNAIDCAFNGSATAHGATGLFDAQATTSGAQCGFTAPLKGVVVPLGMTNDKPQLAIELDSADNAQSAVFIVTKQ